MALEWQTEYHRYRRYFLNITRLYGQKKVRVYTEIVFSLLTISFFLFFAIKPTFVTITGLIKTIKDQKLVAQKLKEKINALNLAQNQYVLAQPNLYLIDEALPESPQVSFLIKQLEALARHSQVKLVGIQFNQVDLKDDSRNAEEPIKFSLIASGNYQNLKDFLKNIIVLRRIVLIEAFSFRTSKNETEETGGLNLSLNAKAYWGIKNK